MGSNKKPQPPERIVELRKLVDETANALNWKQFDYLTDIRRRLLVCHFLPETCNLMVHEKAEVCDCSVRVIYLAFSNQWFLDAKPRVARAIMGMRTPKILNNYLKKAEQGGHDGLGDRHVQERILEQVGILDKVDGNISPVTINVALIAQERQKNQIAGFNRLGYKLEFLGSNGNNGNKEPEAEGVIENAGS